MTDRQEIAPCPFCGGECYVAAESMIATLYRVCCVDCGYRSPGFGADDTAVAEHSRIATAIPLERVREAARILGAVAYPPDLSMRALCRELGVTLEQSDEAD